MADSSAPASCLQKGETLERRARLVALQYLRMSLGGGQSNSKLLIEGLRKAGLPNEPTHALCQRGDR
jgi:hypothetical protein